MEFSKHSSDSEGSTFSRRRYTPIGSVRSRRRYDNKTTHSILTDSSSRRRSSLKKNVTISDVLCVHSYQSGSPPREKLSKVTLVHRDLHSDTNNNDKERLRELLKSDRALVVSDSIDSIDSIKNHSSDLQKARESLREINNKRPSMITKWKTLIFCIILVIAILLILIVIVYYLHRTKRIHINYMDKFLKGKTITTPPVSNMHTTPVVV